jgi:phosphotriesterase-related protein
MIRTVLGDVSIEEISGAFLHEHLIIDSQIVKSEMPHIFLDSVSDAISEVKECISAGVNLLVDCMPGESGRNVGKLRDISRKSGVHIVAATGVHNPKYYEKGSKYLSAGREELADIFVSEISERCGIIKIHSLGEELSAFEAELFAAAVQAQNVTGAPIITHCEEGKGALAQISEFQKLDADLKRIVLSHTDKYPNHRYHQEILSSGINVEYDQSLRQSEKADRPSLELTVAMCNAGFTKQIMLGTDGARRTLWKSLGGSPGLSWLANGWRQLLVAAGLPDADLSEIYRENPRRFLRLSEIRF